MLQRLIDNVRDSTASALRQTAFAAVAALALLVMISFLCAAGFVFMLHTYGPVPACLAGAATFLIVALVAGGCYMASRRQAEVRAALRAKSAARSALADPAVVATGLQLARAIGVKRLIPILAVGGLALGLMASRSQASDQAPAE